MLSHLSPYLRVFSVVCALCSILGMGAGSAARAESVGDALAQERKEQTGTVITVLFDNSGSMRGEKLRQAKSAFEAWLKVAPDDYKFSLITFEKGGQLHVPIGPNTRDRVAQQVEAAQAISNTPICASLKIARNQIETRRRDVTPYERHVVLIFTDGQENVDPRGIDGVCAEIRELRSRSVEVMGIGFHGEGDYMRGVASRFALANNEAELRQGLAKVDAEIGNADDIVATPADLEALKHFKPQSSAPGAPGAVNSGGASPKPATPSSSAQAPVTNPVASTQTPSGNAVGGKFSPMTIIVIGIAIFLVRRLFLRSSR